MDQNIHLYQLARGRKQPVALEILQEEARAVYSHWKYFRPSVGACDRRERERKQREFVPMWVSSSNNGALSYSKNRYSSYLKNWR